MRDFPVNAPPSIDNALKKVHTRYDKLNNDYFISLLACVNSNDFTKFFNYLPLLLHQYLFSGILSNAELYRQGTDLNNGVIFFGPAGKFEGYPPKNIEIGLQMAGSHLIIDESNAVHNAVKFYQQFVMVHPFYDANGRIGRFTVETYLNFHGTSIRWRGLYANTKWLKKLNECHKRFNKPQYDRYLDYLVDHWHKYTFKEDVDFDEV